MPKREDTVQRCGWVSDDEAYRNYHDLEWGVAVYDDAKLFEFLILEGFQAGLSWLTILRKRDNFRRAFDHFDAATIAQYDDATLQRLAEDKGIVRNRLKIKATVTNAQRFLEVQQESGSFSDYIWQFVDGQPIINHWQSLADVPATTLESDAMSKALKKRGFKFVGSTICYAYMQAVGMVMDHTVDCFRYKELA